MNRKEIQAIRTKKRIDDKLLKFKGVVGVDVEYKRIKGEKTDTFCIAAFVKKKLAREELPANEIIPVKIEGIPTDVIECPNIWPSEESSQRMATEDRPKKARTSVLDGGLSICNQYRTNYMGTLGIVLKQAGYGVALSCAHIMVRPPPTAGQHVIEPGGGTYPADSIGEVTYAEYQQNNVDAALTRISGRFYNLANVLLIGRVVGWGIGFVDNVVKKVGITTGLTTGKISSNTFTWKTSDPTFGPITLTNQIRIDGQFALAGDSGAALVKEGEQTIVQGGNSGPDFFTVCNPSGMQY